MLYYIDFYCKDCGSWQHVPGEEVKIVVKEYVVGEHRQVEASIVGECKSCGQEKVLDSKIEMLCRHSFPPEGFRSCQVNSLGV